MVNCISFFPLDRFAAAGETLVRIELAIWYYFYPPTDVLKVWERFDPVVFPRKLDVVVRQGEPSLLIAETRIDTLGPTVSEIVEILEVHRHPRSVSNDHDPTV